MASQSSKHRKKSAPTAKPASSASGSPTRWVIVGVLIVAAIYGAYRVLSVSNGRGAVSAPASTSTSQPTSAAQQSAGNVTGPEVVGTAKLVDGVQKISVDVSTTYDPNVIQLKAGIPAELTFGQGQGCRGVVHSQELGFSEDLSSGPKTVKLKGLSSGTYGFSCGMDMVFGEVVVR